MIQQTLARKLAKAAEAAAAGLGADPAGIPSVELTRPRQKEHGDWATNLALVWAPALGRPPRDVAAAIVRELDGDGLVTKIDVAGPGFINLSLGHVWLHRVLGQVLEHGDRYGRGDRTGERLQVEYVSANPTGPLHVGTARNAALGDSLANVLDAAGCAVEREYYFNDAGRQIELFGASVEARYLQRFGVSAEPPEDGYHGEHVAELAEEI